MKIGFLGLGNMGGAIAKAAALSRAGEDFCFCDTDASKVAAFTRAYGGSGVTLSGLADCEVIFLGVKPGILPALLSTLAEAIEDAGTSPLVISMAAGVTLATLEEALPAGIRVIRMMPNVAVSAGEGMILYSLGREAGGEEEATFLSLLAKAGKTDRLSEALLDAGTALSGCGPAYVYLMLEAMADAGVESGLARDKAELYAAQTLLGAAKLYFESGRKPGELKDSVCSPGGSTIAGVHALEKSGFRGAVMEAVSAALRRTRELG